MHSLFGITRMALNNSFNQNSLFTEPVPFSHKFRKMSTYEKICALFDGKINGDCSNKTTRILLTPLLMSMDLYEKEREANIRQKLFNEACTEFQWFYWTAEDYYGGVGEWREFPPVCASRLNKAVREGKSTVQVTLAQHNYTIDFNEMTKRLVNENANVHNQQNSMPIFVQAKLHEGFTVEKLTDILTKLHTTTDQHRTTLHGILKIIRSSTVELLDADLACISLTMLLRLLTMEGMVAEFMEAEGIEALIQMRCTNEVTKGSVTSSLMSTIISLVFRHCIDSEKPTLRETYEQTIKQACSGLPICMLESTSRRHALRAKRYQKDPKRVFRILAPLAATSPKTFCDAVNNCLMLKKNELQLKEQPEKENNVESSHLKTVLQKIVYELPFGGPEPEKANRLLQPTSLLNFVAELLRSYAPAAQIFVDLTSDGQTVLKRIIDKFLLNNTAFEQYGTEIPMSAKAVLYGLVANKATPKVTDQLVDDIRALLHSVTKEFSTAQLMAENAEVKGKTATKFAERLSTLIQLCIFLRETVAQTNVIIQPATKAPSAVLVKSIHKKNLLNDFVRSIWNLPLHEKQGYETVNALLKLFEGLVGRDIIGLGLVSSSSTHTAESTGGGVRIVQASLANPDADTATSSSAPSTSTANVPPIDIRGNAQQQQAQADGHQQLQRMDEDFINRSLRFESSSSTGDAESMQNADETVGIGSINGGGGGSVAGEGGGGVGAVGGGIHPHAVADISRDNDEEEDEDESHPDDDSTHTDEDMDTAEELEAMREAVAQAAAEEDDDEEMEDNHNSEHMPGEEVDHANPNMPVDDMADEMDDDDDDEEEEEEDDGEGEENDETLVEFENALADYMDMNNFAEITNEVNQIRQDVNRINVNLRNIAANRNMHAADHDHRHALGALAQHMPRNIRALLGHHPHSSAVLRIRNPTQNIARSILNLESRFNRADHFPIQIGIGHEGLMLHHPLAGHWTGRDGLGDEQNIERMIPQFVDRHQDLTRIMDPQAMFHIATILASHLLTTIKVPEPPVLTAESKKKKEEAEQQENTVVTTSSNTRSDEAVDTAQQVERAQLPDQRRPQPQQAAEQQAQQPEEQMAPEQQQQQATAQPQEQSAAAVAEDVQMPAVAESGGTSTEQAAAHTPPTTRPPTPPPFVGGPQEQAAAAAEVTATANEPAQPAAAEPATTTAGEQQANVAQGEATAPAPGVPDGVDPAFLAALPEDMRQEVIRDHLIQQQLNNSNTQAAAEQDMPPERLAVIMGMEVPEGMDPAFLAALPADIFQEVVRDHQRQQELTRRRQQVAAHRHFTMPHFFGAGGRIGARAHHHQQAPQPQMPTTISTDRAVQLFDRESICTLLLLYFLDQDKFNIARLQKLLRSICVHPGSCDFVIWALLSILDGLEKFEATENAEGEKAVAQTGWVNNLRLGTSLDKNERILQITQNTVYINQQIRLSAAHHAIDSLAFLAQRFAKHFMPKAIRQGTADKFEQPPAIGHFWAHVRSINNKGTDDSLKAGGGKLTGLWETAVEHLEKSPFAHILKFVDSQLAKNNQAFMDKVIRTAFTLSQGLTPDFHEGAPPETKQWVGKQMGDLVNIVMENTTENGLRDGRALVAQLFGLFPSERAQIMGALHETIKNNAEQLRGQLGGLQKELDEKSAAKNEVASTSKSTA